MEPIFLTVDEAAEYLRIHRLSIYRLLKSGALPGALKVGRVWRIPQSAFDQLQRLPQKKQS